MNAVPTFFRTTPKAFAATLPRFQFEGKIVVVQGEAESRRAVAALRNETVLGFDTETRPVFTKGPMRPPALVQISTASLCFLFRIHRSGLTPALRGLLANPDVVKVGLSLNDDLCALRRTGRFSPGGWVDLQDVVKRLNIEDLGLQRLFANVFRQRISKSQQRSNWEADVLSEPQKVYAATDAYACLKLYEVLRPLDQGAPYQLTDPPEL
ncbi:MAG: 3'-5' exonuclease domain-containing protein 2 [Bacteroidaceae bacterium]|nr:3'-5' exonuclease domain-containing protein 2 [Bacteroidaceae bacterium]